MPDTITESELTAMKNEFIADSKYPYATPDAMRYALKHVGITVIPDPIPEPEGDVIVEDKDGDPWTRTNGGWTTRYLVGGPYAWVRMVDQYGPVKIYRLEERGDV